MVCKNILNALIVLFNCVSSAFIVQCIHITKYLELLWNSCLLYSFFHVNTTDSNNLRIPATRRSLALITEPGPGPGSGTAVEVSTEEDENDGDLHKLS